MNSSSGKGLLSKKHGHVHILAFSNIEYKANKDNIKSTTRYFVFADLII